jgi:hypothetical protein
VYHKTRDFSIVKGFGFSYRNPNHLGAGVSTGDAGLGILLMSKIGSQAATTKIKDRAKSTNGFNMIVLLCC